MFPLHVDSLRSPQTHEIPLGTNNFSGPKVPAFQKFPDDLKRNPEKLLISFTSPTEHLYRYTSRYNRSRLACTA